MKKLFTNEQIDFILTHYENMKYKDIAIYLYCKPEQIAGWLSNNGYKKSKRSIFSENDVSYIKQNYKTMKYKQIADILGFSERQIRHYVEHYCDNKNRKFNKRYFQFIDTPTKAYFLEYIYADGYVCSNVERNSYEFGMQLQLCDIKVLQDLNFELGNVHNISIEHSEK